MDADQRLVGLKRAYADIILNMAKEAAARVAASETKAVRLEKELKDSKEQALQMLLRLKKMMDCKVVEAEMTSFNQQREIEELNGQLRAAADTICKAESTSLNQNKKIEELEAQLNEAEDIVKDLREELKEAHTELERARKNKPQSNETFVAATKETEVHVGNLNVGTRSVLPPIPEDNSLNTSQPIISSLFPVSKKSESMTNSNLSPRNAFSVRNSNERKAFIPSILLKSKGPEFCGNRRTQRIRAFEEKLMAGELSFTDRTYDVDVNHERNVKEDGGGGASETCRVENKPPKVSATGQKWRKFGRCKKKKVSSTKDLYNRSRKIEEIDNALSEEEPSNTVPKLPAVREDETQCGHEKVGVSDQEFIKNEIVESTMDKDLASMSVKKVEVPAVTIATERPGTTNGIDDQPVTERVFKYTFQRKRKRESLNNSGKGTPAEETVLKKSTAERPNCPEEKEKCGSITESSRDSRRLALFAHQLISLSEKKW